MATLKSKRPAPAAAPMVQQQPYRAFEVMGLGAVMFRLMGPTVGNCKMVYEAEAVEFANEHGIALIRNADKADNRLPQPSKTANANAR